MTSGTGIRLNGALSILLVMLLILGGMASLSSLEMNDAAAAGDNDNGTADSDEKKETSTLEKSESAWLERCKEMKNNMRDRGEWDINSDTPLRESNTASGRQGDAYNNNSDSNNNGHSDDNTGAHGDQSDENNDAHGDQSDENTDAHDGESDHANTDVDWHLPDNIEVFRTAYGQYVIRIVHEDGTVTEEVLTEEEFASFLSEYGWDTTDEVDEHQTDRVEHDLEREEEVSMNLEIMDDGTIIITRTHGDWVEYEIIRTNEDGLTTVIHVSPEGTEIYHSQPERQHRSGGEMTDRDRGSEGFAPLFTIAGEMNEGFEERCQELMRTDKPAVNVDVLRIDRLDTQREEQRD